MALLGRLTIKEIHAKMNGHLIFTHTERQKKERLLERVIRDASPNQLAAMLEAARQKSPPSWKQKREASTDHRQEGQGDGGDNRHTGGKRDHAKSPAEFLYVPSEEEIRACYASCYDATSNAAVEQATCGMCARECSIIEDGISSIPLSLLPDSHRLIPRNSHPAHDLFDGRLLEPAGVDPDGDDPVVSVCEDCLQQEANHPPNTPWKIGCG